MRSSLLMSVVLHITIILVSVLGLPYIQRTPAMEEVPMVVDLVSIASKTEIPFQSVQKPKPKLQKPKPKLSEPKQSLPIPKKSEPKLVVKQPKTEPTLKSKVKSEPDVIDKPRIKPIVPKKLKKVTPRRKPKPPDPFALVLKNLEKEMKKTQKPFKRTKKEKRENVDFEQQVAKALTSTKINDSPSTRVTMTEIHAMINTIRTAIMPCWNLQPGAKGAQDIVVIIRASLNPDGRVARAWVKNRSILVEDPFKLAAAETAQRAILNQACQPFKLDPTKYDVWKDVTLNFNPSEMFGK